MTTKYKFNVKQTWKCIKAGLKHVKTLEPWQVRLMQKYYPHLDWWEVYNK
ncbi:hypothetical protein LCGC14_0267150 [marine sediment metagenome]|uniref:Uncharacterized protein n=1 Tax=marine sediment metagenome TaxID=412755 RepID=A0A0F9U4L3_9ZZZZ